MLNAFKMTTAVAALSILSLGACSVQPIGEKEPPAEAMQKAQQIIEPWVSDTSPGVAVAVSWNDEVVLARGAGLANLEHIQPIRPESVFQVASVSKQFTAFAALLLVSEGAMDLDADIRTYIPEFPETETAITVRHLLDHASGLREQSTLSAMAGWMEDDVRTKAQSMDLIFRQRGVNFNAGDKVEYSNTGYALLAEIIARVSGQPFHVFMHERIFAPLEMTQTRFPENRNALITGRASSYYPHGSGFKNVIAASESTGSTGLYTTALDLLKWAENFDRQRVGSPNVFKMMEERFQAYNGAESTFAKGQELRPYHGLETWSHGGRDAGYRSFLLRIPGEDFAVSILSNRTDFDTAQMAFALVDAFLSSDPDYQFEALEEWLPATPEQLAAYAGDYEIYPGIIFSVRAERGGLTFAPLKAARDNLEPLAQIGEHEFLLSESPELALKFQPSIDGVSPGFGYRIGLHGTIEAQRIELEDFDPDTVNLAQYAGRCESAELATHYELKITDQRLVAKHSRLPEFMLTPYQEDTFAGQGPLQKLEFVRDVGDTIVGFYASASLAERIWFSCA